MKKFLFSVLILGVFCSARAQKYYTKTGNISFSATSSIEAIEAKTKTASCVIDAATGNIEFAVLIKTFLFEKALMQEHFNENYLESDKYPKGSFKGKIDNIKDVKFNKDGTYKAKVSGTLEIHGVARPVSTTAEFAVSGGKIKANANFSIILVDYNVKIPGAVSDKISKSAKIGVIADFQELKK
jgi:hypothetical protein